MKTTYYIEIKDTDYISGGVYFLGILTEKQALKETERRIKELWRSNKERNFSLSFNLCTDEDTLDMVYGVSLLRGDITIYDYRTETFVKDTFQERYDRRKAKWEEEDRRINLLSKIESVAEENGWGCYHSERYGEKDSLDFEFSKYTTMGQDFNVSAIMNGYDVKTLIENVKSGADSYDPDEEAILCTGPDGHGRNGAPYRLSDIITDMEEAKQMYQELAEVLEHAFNKE